MQDSGFVSGCFSNSNFRSSHSLPHTSQASWRPKCFPKSPLWINKRASIRDTPKSIHLWGFHLASLCLCSHTSVCTCKKKKKRAIRLECKQNNDWGLINTSCPLCAQEQFMETTQLSLYREGTRQLVCKQATPTQPEPENNQKRFHLDMLPAKLI